MAAPTFAKTEKSEKMWGRQPCKDQEQRPSMETSPQLAISLLKSCNSVHVKAF